MILRIELHSWLDKFSDDEISQCRKPKSYTRDFRYWPTGAWVKRDYHLYHIKSLARAMKKKKSWIGTPLRIYPNGQFDGNHRLRALTYARLEVSIPISFATEVRSPLNLSWVIYDQYLVSSK